MEVRRWIPCVLVVCLQMVLALGAEQVTDANLDAATNEFKCEEEGIFPDPYDCHSYYRCTNKLQATHESCIWSYFDPIKKGCFFGGCSIWTKPSLFGLSAANTTTSADDAFKCSTIGQFPDPKDCQRYYSCNSKLTWTRKICFWGFGHYDIENNICTVGFC